MPRKTKTRTSADARKTFVQDPEQLPDFGEVVEATVVEDARDMAPVAPMLPELAALGMLDTGDELVSAIREITSIVPVSEEEHIQQAERVRNAATFLITQKKRMDMLLAELAYYLRQHKLWRFLGDHCQSETHFWQLCNGARLETINQLIEVRAHVVPMLHAAAVPDKVLEEIDHDKAKELVKLAREVKNEQRAPEVVAEQIHTIVNASPEDLNALRQLARGEEVKQAVVITMQPQMTVSGRRRYACTFYLDEELVRAYAAKNTYFVHSVGGESIHPSRLPETLEEWDITGDERPDATTVPLASFDPTLDDIDFEALMEMGLDMAS